MTYGRHAENEFAASIREDMLGDRLNSFAKVGPLLDDKMRGALEWKIQDETKLPLKDVQHIVDTLNATVGQSVPDKREQTRDVTMGEIKQAFEGTVTNPRFLDRIAAEILPVMDRAMEAREKRVEGLKMGTPVAAGPATAAPAPATQSK